MIGWLMPIEQIPRFFPMYYPALVKACSRLPMWTPEKAIYDALNDQIELWLIFSEEDNQAYGVCGTQIHIEDGERVLEILLLGGWRWKEWGFLFDELKSHARRNDCPVIRFTGRRGWARLLPEVKQVGWSKGRPIFDLRIE
ncbi:MAG: hypothetical protein N4A65_00350 [Cohaesibacter sp.]|jgi:hypothetical protein|nr:hypothetical protein [Cohaesibacter sp.]